MLNAAERDAMVACVEEFLVSTPVRKPLSHRHSRTLWGGVDTSLPPATSFISCADVNKLRAIITSTGKENELCKSKCSLG